MLRLFWPSGCLFGASNFNLKYRNYIYSLLKEVTASRTELGKRQPAAEDEVGVGLKVEFFCLELCEVYSQVEVFRSKAHRGHENGKLRFVHNAKVSDALFASRETPLKRLLREKKPNHEIKSTVQTLQPVNTVR